MSLMLACGVLVVVGVVAVVRWGGVAFQAPPTPGGAEGGSSSRAAASRYLSCVTIAVASGMGSGILVAGAGGRLVMRLLAATSGDAAQGRETEAEEIVGRITTAGSISFIVFTALFFGVASGVLYLVIRRWLPPGRLGGLTYGLLLLIVAAPAVDPLRADNPDFDLVGPGWLAVLVFSAVVVVHGMLVSALAGRYSHALPPPSLRRRALVAYLPLLLLVPAAPLGVLIVIVGLVVVGASRAEPVMRAVRSRRTTVAGTIALPAVALVALPRFVSTVLDIAGS